MYETLASDEGSVRSDVGNDAWCGYASSPSCLGGDDKLQEPRHRSLSSPERVTVDRNHKVQLDAESAATGVHIVILQLKMSTNTVWLRV